MNTSKAFFLLLCTLGFVPCGCECLFGKGAETPSTSAPRAGLSPGLCINSQCSCNPDPQCLVSACPTSSGACTAKLASGAQCFKGETYKCANGKVVTCSACSWQPC